MAKPLPLVSENPCQDNEFAEEFQCGRPLPVRLGGARIQNLRESRGLRVNTVARRVSVSKLLIARIPLQCLEQPDCD